MLLTVDEKGLLICFMAVKGWERVKFSLSLGRKGLNLASMILNCFMVGKG